MESKNVKLPIELIDMVKVRAPDVPPGETLFTIYREYEKLEALSKCLADTDATLNKSSVFETFKSYILNNIERFEAQAKRYDDLITMIKRTLKME
jgi:hypothetical protein